MIILSTAYLAPVHYYARLYAAREAVVDVHEHYVKQTYRNRCCIATPQGPLALTVPVVRNKDGRGSISEVEVSSHGNWRHLHWNALVSAYESSPFFEYYADDFKRVLDTDFRLLTDLNRAFHELIVELLALDCRVRESTAYQIAALGDLDLREVISPKAPSDADAAFRPAPYYQVFAARTGFLPNLSIADLLFNMGPESRLVLRNSLSL
ncbi:MAG: WbqC family protein [Alloprevotella sp.]